MRWATLLTSVGLYTVMPVVIAQLWRRWMQPWRAWVPGPWSMAALLAKLVLLFAFQGEAILAQPLIIAMLAVLIEVPAMLLVVSLVNRSKGWYARGAAAAGAASC